MYYCGCRIRCLHPLPNYCGCSCTHCTHGSYAYVVYIYSVITYIVMDSIMQEHGYTQWVKGRGGGRAWSADSAPGGRQPESRQTLIHSHWSPTVSSDHSNNIGGIFCRPRSIFDLCSYDRPNFNFRENRRFFQLNKIIATQLWQIRHETSTIVFGGQLISFWYI